MKVRLSFMQPTKSPNAARFYGSRAIIYKFKANLMFPRGKRDHEIYEYAFYKN